MIREPLYRIVRSGLSDRVKVELCDYRDVRSEKFDKIVSVGMFEHVGESQLPAYFALTYRNLKPGGRSGLPLTRDDLFGLAQ